MRELVLSTAYFAPVHYYATLLREGFRVYIEKHENFNKQSYRNRCTIYTANGLLDLIVPVKRGQVEKKPITQVEISYDMPWQKRHIRAIESAYRRSPFYEYYIDDLVVFFTERYQRLYELNMNILKKIYKLLDVHLPIYETEAYFQNKNCNDIVDFRFEVYTQVFDNKYGFKQNMSILDLIFNIGPETKNYLKNI